MPLHISAPAALHNARQALFSKRLVNGKSGSEIESNYNGFGIMEGAQIIVTFIHSMVGLLCCMMMIFAQMLGFRDSYRVKVSGPITIGKEWVEFNPKTYLKAEKTFQW